MNSSENNQISWKTILQKYLEKLDYKYKSYSNSNSIDIPFKIEDQSLTITIITGDKEFPESSFITLFTQHEFNPKNSIEKTLDAINSINKKLPFGCISLLPEFNRIQAKTGQRINSKFIAEDLDEMIDFTIFLYKYIYKDDYLNKTIKLLNP